MAKLLELAGLGRLWRSPAAIGTLAVNLLPLAGVVLWGWNAAMLVVLYWLENLVIGVINAAKMVLAGAAHGRVGLASLLFFLPFFTVHFGIFCLVHGVFVVMLFGSRAAGADAAPAAVGPSGPDILELARYALSLSPQLGAVLGVIAAWRLASFALFYALRGDYRHTNPADQMMAPYGRIALLHLAIFAGAFAMALLGEPMWGVALLVLAKAAFEALAELRGERKAAPSRAGAAFARFKAGPDRGSAPPPDG